MKTFLLSLVLLALPVFAAPPVVTNVRAAQIAGTKNVEILYDVSDADGDSLSIAMQVSGDAGQTYTIPASALSGHIGAGVAPGANRRIVWNAGADWNGQLVSQAKVRLTATDGTTPAPPPGMVYIPAGVFQMGDNFGDAGISALPVHQVVISGFFVESLEISKEIYDSVAAWAAGNNYGAFSASARGNGHPATRFSWCDALRWCNARSEKEGLQPCYYTDMAHTAVYKSGIANLTNAHVDWTASGYRLPTEAEWEKAARGGVTGTRYPWADGIGGSDANYSGSGDPFETYIDGRGTTPVGYFDGGQAPLGPDRANGYGLYDVVGNAIEWCWDYWSQSYYGVSSVNDPRGPDGPSDGNFYRVLRGGSFADPIDRLSLAWREAHPAGSANRSNGSTDFGIRCVRKAP